MFEIDTYSAVVVDEEVSWVTKIKNVAIVGGTHGNELTGPHLLRRWEQFPEEVTRSSFMTRLFLGNPKAFEENRRFIDDDLNRSFGREVLQSATVWRDDAYVGGS